MPANTNTENFIQQLNRYYYTMHHICNDQELDYANKIKLLIYFGSGYIFARINIAILEGYPEPNHPLILESLQKLSENLETPIEELINNQKYFINLATSAYNIQMYEVLYYCVHAGARLNYNSFFMQAYKECSDNPQYMFLVPILHSLLFDNIPQVWDSQNKDPINPAYLKYLTPPQENLAAAMPAAFTPQETSDAITEVITLETPITPVPETELITITPMPEEDAAATTTTVAPIINTDNTVIKEITPEEKQQQLIKATLDKMDSATCNLLLQTEARSQIITTLRLEPFNNKNNKSINIFINELKLTIDECLACIKNITTNIRTKKILCIKMLNFADQEIYQLSQKEKLQIVFASFLQKSKPDQELKNSWRTKLRQLKTKYEAPIEQPQEKTPEPHKEKAIEVPQQKPIVSIPVTNASIIQEALQKMDFATINLQVKKSRHRQATLDILNNALTNSANTFTDDFLISLMLPEEFYVATVTNAQIPNNVFKSFMQQVLCFELEIYFKHDILHNFCSIVSARQKETAEDFTELAAAVNSKQQQIESFSTDYAKTLFKSIYDAPKGSKLKIDSYILAANIMNANMQSALMLAIENQLHIQLILKLIENAHAVICRPDKSGRNVLHYWATKITQDSLRILKPLWEKYKTEIAYAKELFILINSKYSVTGDTYIHTLIKNNDPDNIKLALEALFSIEEGRLFAAAFLLRNNDNKTPLDLLQESRCYRADIEKLILTKVTDVCFPLAIEFKDTIYHFFPKNKPFFLNVASNIQNLIERGEISRILEMIDLHNSLRISLLKRKVSELSNSLSKNSPYKAQEIKNIIIQHFGETELLLEIDNKLLIEIINEHAVKPENHTILEQINYSVYLETEKLLHINKTIAWLRLKQHLSKSQESKLSSTELNQYIERIKSRINKNVPGTSSNEFEHVIVEEDYELTKFLHKHCGAVITLETLEHAILYAFRILPGHPIPKLDSKRADVANYLFNNSAAKIRESETTALLMKICIHVLTEPLNCTLLHWIVANDFTYDLTFNDNIKRNFLQKILERTNNENVASLIPTFKLMFDAATDVNDIVNYKDTQGHSCLYYLFTCAVKGSINRDNLIELLDIFLTTPINLFDIGMQPGETPLYFAVILEDARILDLFYKHISDSALLALLNTKDKTNNTTVIDYAEKMLREGKIKSDILDKLQSKLKELQGFTELQEFMELQDLRGIQDFTVFEEMRAPKLKPN